MSAAEAHRRRQPRTALTAAQLALLDWRMRQLGMRSKAELASKIGREGQSVTRWWQGVRGPSLEVLERVSEVLQLPLVALRVPEVAAQLWEAVQAEERAGRGSPAGRDGSVGPLVPPPVAPLGRPLYNLEQHVVLEQPSDRAEGWPIYDGAGAGDPVAAHESERPVPVARRLLQGELVSVIGRRGFGVVVRGESMSGWEFHDGDVVWVNPDLGVRENWPNLFLVCQGGEWGMVLKRLVVSATSRWLVSDGAEGKGEPIPYEDARPIGPVVRHTRESVPRRRTPLDAQRDVDAHLAAVEQAALDALTGDAAAPPEAQEGTPPTPLRRSAS